MLHYLGTLKFDFPFQFEAAAGVGLARDQPVTGHGLCRSTVAPDLTPTTVLTQDDQPPEPLPDYIGHHGTPTFRC
jgi:hypothetical protein